MRYGYNGQALRDAGNQVPAIHDCSAQSQKMITHSANSDNDDESNNRNKQSRKQHEDEMLDDALKNTFPASDPVELTPTAE
jgi:hypothetical protein